MRAPVLNIADLSVAFPSGSGEFVAVDKISLAISPREALGLIGESGSGKSLTSMSCLGLLPPSARIEGSVSVNGSEMVGADSGSLSRVRGATAAMIFQNPMVALNPFFTIERQLTDIILQKRDVDHTEARKLAAHELDRVKIPRPKIQLSKYPHQFSGGQLQRIMIAAALACEPALLIADEPTTALDVTVQAEILKLLSELRAESDLALLFVTHDLGVVADLCDKVAVMESGCIVEQGPTLKVLGTPEHRYTKKLLASLPSMEFGKALAKSNNPPEDKPLVHIEGACKSYQDAHGTIKALDNVDLTIERGRSAAIVGESGSGKSTLAMSALGLVDLDEGHIEIDGVAIQSASRGDLIELRKRIGVVFQNPYSSLNPRMRILDIVAEPLRTHGEVGRRQQHEMVAELLDLVGIDKQSHRRRPGHFSGGQRQRIAIARALILEPDLLILDEPTAALDVSLQAQIIELLKELQGSLNLSYLLITHNLAIVDDVADEVLVMKRGQVVERGPVRRVFTKPDNAYTRKLLDAVPQLPAGMT